MYHSVLLAPIVLNVSKFCRFDKNHSSEIFSICVVQGEVVHFDG